MVTVCLFGTSVAHITENLLLPSPTGKRLMLKEKCDRID
jgi:hypothetical protein